MTTVDWASLRKTADDASKPLPPEWYDVVCEKAEATVASTGSHMIKVTLRVVGGPFDGRPLWTNLVLSPDSGFALSIFFRNLAAFGVDPAVVAPGGSLEEIAYVLPNRTARAQVGVRTWQGQERNEVLNMVPSGNVQVGAPAAGPAGGSGVPSPIGVPNTGPVPTTPSTPTITPSTPSIPTPPPTTGEAPQLPF